MLAVLVDEIDVTVPGLRAPRRVNVKMTEEDRALVRKELRAFSDRVSRCTRGRLEIRLRVVTAPGPLTTLTGPGPYWIGPRDATPLLPELGNAETVMVFARIGTPDGPAVPVRHLGGAVGGDRGPGGACFVGIGFRTGWIDGTGTVALHEFLHGLRWAIVDVGGAPPSSFPDPDEGRAGPTCCKDAPSGDGPYADHLLTHHLLWPDISDISDKWGRN